MFIKIESTEISNIDKILINYFFNVKDKKSLAKMIYRYIANYYILSIKKSFDCKITYDPNNNDYSNFFNVLIDDFNYYFDENITIKKEKIDIIIEKWGI